MIDYIAPVLKAVNWSQGTTQDFLRTIRDESGLLTGWGPEHYGFMHLGFQEYLAAREIRTRAFEEPEVLRKLASHFGESWWQEVALLLLALEDPSLFVPYMREVVKLPAFAEHPNLVELCLDDAAETSPKPFEEILRKDPGKSKQFWSRQLVALRVLAQLDTAAVEAFQSKLARHPSANIRNWIRNRLTQAALDTIVAERGGYEMVRIIGDTFMMGSPESEEGREDFEGPLHKVIVSDFYLGRYPITNEEYGRFLNENPETPEPEYWAERKYNQPRQPVVGVSWEDAQRYAAWAGLRLPTEAEWEYACRAGTNTRFYAGDTEEDLEQVGWYYKNSGEQLHPVGEKDPNAFGLYDMHGNVWEWMEDDWHSDYKGAPEDGRAWIDDPRGAYRVVRGGSWYGDARDCRAANRSGNRPDGRSGDLGFRLARSAVLGP
jgi:formylglycine-generating enzyme required for sulfatase activity